MNTQPDEVGEQANLAFKYLRSTPPGDKEPEYAGAHEHSGNRQQESRPASIGQPLHLVILLYRLLILLLCSTILCRSCLLALILTIFLAPLKKPLARYAVVVSIEVEFVLGRNVFKKLLGRGL